MWRNPRDCVERFEKAPSTNFRHRILICQQMSADEVLASVLLSAMWRFPSLPKDKHWPVMVRLARHIEWQGCPPTPQDL